MRSPGPLFSTRPVVGKNDTLFEMLSFRTIGSNKACAKQGTYLGVSYLCEHGLDTIPRFINVLRGEMSLVGPLPFSPGQQTLINGSIGSNEVRQLVKPGIIGLSQLERQNVDRGVDCHARQAARYDRFYAKHWSLGLDLRCILAATFRTLRWSK
jgi:putative colanic acid biosynthesis UDP-glucose lipid carrier transferase